jgi:archaellin
VLSKILIAFILVAAIVSAQAVGRAALLMRTLTTR